jgi:hypothetical protein
MKYEGRIGFVLEKLKKIADFQLFDILEENYVLFFDFFYLILSPKGSSHTNSDYEWGPESFDKQIS